MRQVEPRAFSPDIFRSTWVWQNAEYHHTRFTLLNQISNSLFYLFGTSTFLHRLRDDVKHQAEELTTVQSRLRDCQTALSDAEVLHCTVRHRTLLHRTLCPSTVKQRLKCHLDAVSYSLSPVKFYLLSNTVIISCHRGDRSDIISYIHHVIVPAFGEVVCHILSVGSELSWTW